MICTVLHRDCIGRCVGTHGKNVQQCHSPDSGTITQKMPTQMSVPPSAELPCLPDTLSQSSGPTIHPQFFPIWTNKLISTKPGNFDNTSKPCRLNYPIWNVLSMEKSAMANSSVALWHLRISRWFWKDVDIDGLKDLLVEE